MKNFSILKLIERKIKRRLLHEHLVLPARRQNCDWAASTPYGRCALSSRHCFIRDVFFPRVQPVFRWSSVKAHIPRPDGREWTPLHHVPL